jgi:hypothetical protein
MHKLLRRGRKRCNLDGLCFNTFRPIQNEPHVVEHPILTAWDPWANFRGSGRADAEAELSSIFDAIAVQHGGSGYLSHLRAGREPDNGRER